MAGHLVAENHSTRGAASWNQEENRLAYVSAFAFSLLVANGENVKGTELMRHASSRFTLDVYSQARKGAKRQAQHRVVQLILPESFNDAVPAISLEDARTNQ